MSACHNTCLRRVLRHRSGTVLVALLVALVLVGGVAGLMAVSSTNDQHKTVSRTSGALALEAAQAGVEMAVKEMMDSVDRDGDGGVGTISNDNNATSDPLIGGARSWATKSTAGGTTLIVGHGAAGDSRHDFQVTLDTPASPTGSGATVLLVVTDAANLDPQESAKRTLFQGWGYLVTTISDTATQAEFDAAARTASVAYISETVLSGNVGTKLTAATIGVVIEESALSDEFGIAASMTTLTSASVTITNTTHYITSAFAAGDRTLFTAGQPVRYLTGALGGYTQLATAGGFPAMAVMERGATLTPSGSAAGRRVYLPFGNTGLNINQLTTDGQTLLKRSIEWCLRPTAHYTLDEGSGSTVTDANGGLNGTRFGAAWTGGRAGGALQFDGLNDYVQVPSSARFQVTRAFSAAGWIKASIWPTDTNWASVILRKGDANPCNWQVCVVAGKAAMVFDDYDTYGLFGATTLSLNQWHHVAGTWDGVTARVYVNGVIDGSWARAAPIGIDTRPVFLGGRSGATDITSGPVDDVRFYERALTAGEVASLAAGGKPRVTAWAEVAP